MPLSRVNLGIVTREWLLAKVGGRGEPDWKAARILHVQFDEERVRDEKGEYEQCLAGLHFCEDPLRYVFLFCFFNWDVIR